MDYEDQDNNIDGPEANQNLKDFDVGSLIRGSKEPNHILYKFAKSKNILYDLEDDQISKLRDSILSGISEDQTSMGQWLMNVDDAQKLAKLTKELKTTPMPESANIKYPLITDACYQFAARTYPEVIQDGKVVKMEIVGDDPDGSLQLIADEGATYMNYQLLGPDNDWEVGIDKLLVMLPNIGFVLKKTYFDPLKRKNVSDICHYKDIILRNDPTILCLSDLRRITHVLHCHPNDLIENARAEIYEEKCVDEIINMYTLGTINPECTLYECHCFADLDDDGYEEPYIVTMHKETSKIVRICARYTKDDIELKGSKVLRINQVQCFTDYHFLPSPDGSYMGIGFGILMLHLNETVNTILNELIDAGKLANLQTGIIDSRIKFPGGITGVDPGTFLRAKGVEGQALKDGIVPLNYKEPSGTLMKLLELLIQTAKDLTSSTDIMQGAAQVQNVPATSMLAMVEQGMKRFSAIQKRVYRSLKEEYQKLARLNGIYGDPVEFQNVTSNTQITLKDVFNNKQLKVFPIADPNLASDAQRLAQAQVVGSLLGKPGINDGEVYTRILQAAKVPHPERIADPKKVAQARQPNPQMAKIQADTQIKGQQNQIKSRAQDLKEKEFAAKLAKIEAEITQMQANAVKLVAEAKSTHLKDKLADHSLSLETTKAKINAAHQAHQQLTNQQNTQQQMQLDTAKAAAQHHQAMIGLGLQAHQKAIDATQNQQSIDQNQQSIDQQGEAQANAESDQETPDNGMDETPSDGSSDGSNPS